MRWWLCASMLVACASTEPARALPLPLPTPAVHAPRHVAARKKPRAVTPPGERFTVHIPDIDVLEGAHVEPYDADAVLVVQSAPRIVLSFRSRREGTLDELASLHVPGVTRSERAYAFGRPALIGRGQDSCVHTWGDCTKLDVEVVFVVIDGEAFVFYAGVAANDPELAAIAHDILFATTFD